MSWLAFKLFLAGVPRIVWKALAALAFAAVLLWLALAWLHDRDAGNYERGRTDYAAEMEAAAKPIIAEQARITTKIETKYVDRIKTVRGRTVTTIREVPVYVSSADCPLSPGFRVLHDASAEGAVPDPADIPDAAPVAAQDAASTVADNYGTYHETAEQLKALQAWVKQQAEANK